MFYILIILTVAAYLLGSVSNAVWIGKVFYDTDVREHGSHNAGATNAMRVLGKKAGFSVFLLDFVKGWLAVALAYLSGFELGSPAMYNLKFVLTAAVVLGHIFPIFAGFRGGKGVSTMAGAVMGIYPPAVLLCLVTFVIVFTISHYVSLASLVAGITLPVYTAFVFGQNYTPLIIFCCIVSVVLIVTHRANIKRLITGTEPKTYLRKRNNKTG